jgi:glutathione reductase (NADPH)
MKKYDVVVIGAGPAGGACASTCAKAGLKVAMIEDYGYGGTCPLRGCNPKKVLTEAVALVAQTQALKGRGLTNVPAINWKELAGFRDSFVLGKKEKIRKAYQGLGIDTYTGRAEFIDQNRVEVGQDVLEGSNFVLATGIKPAKLDIPGEEHISSSDDFLLLNTLPEKICFIGGGFISLEFASVAARAGAKVNIVHKSKRILKHFDPDLTAELARALADAGIDIHLDHPLQSVTRSEHGLIVKAGKDGNEVSMEADMVVHGAGRVPNVDALNLDLPGISFSARGIRVDRYLRCPGRPGFFAVGDVADTPLALTPTADMEGKAAAANIIKPESMTCDYTGTPQVVYTFPPLCAVGLLEEEAARENLKFRMVDQDMAEWFSWANTGQKFARCKILIDEDSDIILGAHILGLGADETASVFAMAIRMKLSVKKMKETLLAYPTRGYYLKNML